MADYPNPYAMPDKTQLLAQLLMSIGGGVSQASSNGMSGWSGVGPGVSNFSNSIGQQQMLAMQQKRQKEADDLRNRQFALQEQEFGFKRQEREDANKRRSGMSDGVLQALGMAPPGMGVPPSVPTMGPGAAALQPNSFDARVASLEGGPRNGGFVQNELGSGAFGPYQFMPNTWADVRAKNPDLNLPADMTQANREQHDAAHQRFRAGNMQALQTAGFEPTPENLYLAHRFGAGGAQTFLRADPNARLADVLPADWQRQNPDMRGQTVDSFRRLAGERMKGVTGGPQAPNIPQGDGGLSGSPMQDIDPQIKAAIAAIAPNDPEKAAAMLVQARSALAKTGAKTDAWYPLGPDDAKMFLGPAYDPNKPLQRNRVTGEVKPIGGSLVNIDQKGQTEFAKAVGKNDAERLKAIQDAEGTMSDMASKIGFAVQQLGDTYTGTGAEGANAFFKALGSFGFEEAGKKANAASAANAIISQMKPHMRASGSGASSDKDMDMFAAALPNLVNLPDGNQRIASYFQRLSDRATQIRQIAEEHSQGGTQPLTGTKFADEVKKLGPLFSEDERKEMMGLGKAKAAPTERPPLDSFGRGGPSATPTPVQRPPLNSFGGSQ